ncbi:MAG: signal peptide peptidase SppA [Thermoanaerobaculia bacterium]
MSDIDPNTTVTPDPGPPFEAAPVEAGRPSPPAIAPPAPQRRSRAGTFFLGAFSGCAIVFLGILVMSIIIAAARNDTTGDWNIASAKIAIVPIEGEILDARDTIDRIHRYAESSTVRAIVMRINSPGGAIAPTQEIYEEIRKAHQETGKPFVASIDSVGASGGFYIAAACDRIVANPGSITGSIGVILQWVEYGDLLAWAKLRPETIKSGALKDAGSPYRPLTDQERGYFQGIVSQLRVQFVRAVADGRTGKMTEAEVSRLADGRVFTGEEALALKLIDQLGNLDDAVVTAAKLAGLKGKPATIYPRRRKPALLDLLTNGDETEAIVQRVLSRPTAKWLYRW